MPKLKRLSVVELRNLQELLDKFSDQDESLQKSLSIMLSLDSRDVENFIENRIKFYGKSHFLALRNFSYHGRIYENATELINTLADRPQIAFLHEIYCFASMGSNLKTISITQSRSIATGLSDTSNMLHILDDLERACQKQKNDEIYDCLRFLVYRKDVEINYEFFCTAILYGDINMVRHLLSSNVVKNNIVEDVNNTAFRLACQNGSLDLVNLLLEINSIKNRVSIDDNLALCLAAKNGCLDVVVRLLEFPSVRGALLDRAFYWAAENGHFDVVNLFLEFEEINDDIYIIKNAFHRAIICERLAVVDRLLKIDKLQRIVYENGNYALHLAAEKVAFLVISRLLEFETVRDKIADKDNEIFRIVAQYKKCDKYKKLASIDLLLEIDAVRNKIANNHNEIIRQAYLNNFSDVVERLLRVDAVRAAILDADNVVEDLRAMAQDKENSQRLLNLQEQGIVHALEKLYPYLDEKKSLNDLKAYLTGRLAKKKLKLELDKKDRKLTKRQLLNIEHQAWRYLFAGSKNKWISPNAKFVEGTSKARQTSITPEDWRLLALIWHALNDENIELSNDNMNLIEKGVTTKEEVCNNQKETFIKTLALLNRAHNFDDNEVDNKGYDEPSCNTGVRRRLLDTMIGLAIAEKPETRPIGVNYLLNRFKEQLITNDGQGILPRLKNLSNVELENLKLLLDKLVLDRDESAQKELLDMLSLRNEEIDIFIKETKKYYGELRFLSLRKLSYQDQIYEDAGQMIETWASNLHISFAQEIYELMNQVKILKKANNEIGTDIDVAMIKNNILQFSQTESSNSRNPAPFTERFGDMQLDSEGFDDLAPPKKKKKLS
ncbi:ankyrin repeat domain-containing protein [Candidatus Berkiella cookevillensis]|uniref:Ankyrin repeat domain-containing protein n=1 Tax=Candidatus Berkiella cookevillensis TaxID=437022 RepID=A0AAE3HR71_9GAMM|nr:ankyrin repeat domain-containing protein [Candidatus Berkiella cookevillensis]